MGSLEGVLSPEKWAVLLPVAKELVLGLLLPVDTTPWAGLHAAPTGWGCQAFVSEGSWLHPHTQAMSRDDGCRAVLSGQTGHALVLETGQEAAFASAEAVRVRVLCVCVCVRVHCEELRGTPRRVGAGPPVIGTSSLRPWRESVRTASSSVWTALGAIASI